MAIRKPEQMDFSGKKFNMVLAGPPGVGKTTVAMSAPNPILFDLDNGVSRLRAEHRGITASNDTYEGLLEDMQSEEYKQAETVIIDTGGSLIQLMQPWAKKQEPKAAKDGRAMFGVIKREFDRLTHQIRAIDKKHCIIIFHTTEVQKGDIVTTRLSCEGSAKDIVWTPADLGCYMFMMGGKRRMGFTPNEEYFAKSCYGISGIRNVPELKPGEKNDFLTRLFEEARQNLENDMAAFAPQKQAYDEAMMQGRALIESADSLETLTAAANGIRNLNHALTSKAELGALIGERAKALGGTWSKEAAAYVPIDSKPA
jgi:hypothetical protein